MVLTSWCSFRPSRSGFQKTRVSASRCTFWRAVRPGRWSRRPKPDPHSDGRVDAVDDEGSTLRIDLVTRPPRGHLSAPTPERRLRQDYGDELHRLQVFGLARCGRSCLTEGWSSASVGVAGYRM